MSKCYERALEECPSGYVLLDADQSGPTPLATSAGGIYSATMVHGVQKQISVQCKPTSAVSAILPVKEIPQDPAAPTYPRPTNEDVALARARDQSLESERSGEPKSPIVGVPTVIDGNTFELRGKRIRLHAIDAPEAQQMCQDAAGRQYGCGRQSAIALINRVSGVIVECQPKTVDKYRRVSAVCYRGQEDLGAWLVRSGLALADRDQGADYVAEENAARNAGVGIWQGNFLPPWEFRQTYR